MASGPVPTPNWAGFPGEPQWGEGHTSKEAHWSQRPEEPSCSPAPQAVCAWECGSVSLRVRPGVSVCVHVRACQREPPSPRGGLSPRAVGSPRGQVRSSPQVVPRAQAGARQGEASSPSPEDVCV